MVFDKTKAMRNAERYLAQGKIQGAISEYKQVVANDAKDFSTLNMLGDLYTKNSDAKLAVRCYTSVAEHYSKQGFAQKAIAVYNKILKLEPGSIEIIEKLAELYRQKGSVNEARTHFKTVAEHHESNGRKLDALEIRKQIASLDPNDTTIYLNLAEAYIAEDQADDAAAAFTEAGIRLAKKSDHAGAIHAFDRAIDLMPDVPKLLASFAQSHFAAGTAQVAAERLADLHSKSPHDRDLMSLLIDCQIEAGDTATAEKSVVGLVEKEPSSHPKLLDLARIYLKLTDAESAARVMTMALEHLLLAGQVDEFQALLEELTIIAPEHIECLRLRSRLASWQRDEAGMQSALIQLAVVAREREAADDERFALSQLVMIMPQQAEYAERLRELNALHGYDDDYLESNQFDGQFMKQPKQAAIEVNAEPEALVREPQLETFAIVTSEPADDFVATVETDDIGVADFAIVSNVSGRVEEVSIHDRESGPDDEKLLREVDSIRFYIDSGYLELAGKAIEELRAEFGSRSEIADLAAHLATISDSGHEQPLPEIVTPPAMPVPEVQAPEAAPVPVSQQPQGLGIDDLRSELGLDEPEPVEDSDYDTHYHTAVAYQEMGLLDEAVREFQEAVSLVQPHDPTRRFFQCAILLGHCFMQKGMPNLALTWYQRALETPGLGDEEKQGLWYELATAYEADGDMESAGRYFEQVYAENINFRDVSERVRTMALSQ